MGEGRTVSMYTNHFLLWLKNIHGSWSGFKARCVLWSCGHVVLLWFLSSGAFSAQTKGVSRLPPAYVELTTARHHPNTDILLLFSQPRPSGASRRGGRHYRRRLFRFWKILLCHHTSRLSSITLSLFCSLSKVTLMCKGESDSIPFSCRDNGLDHEQKQHTSGHHQVCNQLQKQAFCF